ncbi:MAG: toxin-antitoxin system TumE family protein [Woeseiaceae bacterium]
MRAKLLVKRHIVLSADQFAEVVIWQVPKAIAGSAHVFKYRLAFVVSGKCVIRYDNEAGKGDHRHIGEREKAYRFVDLDQLMADFEQDIARWLDENGNA